MTRSNQILITFSFSLWSSNRSEIVCLCVRNIYACVYLYKNMSVLRVFFLCVLYRWLRWRIRTAALSWWMRWWMVSKSLSCMLGSWPLKTRWQKFVRVSYRFWRSLHTWELSPPSPGFARLFWWVQVNEVHENFKNNVGPHCLNMTFCCSTKAVLLP